MLNHPMTADERALRKRMRNRAPGEVQVTNVVIEPLDEIMRLAAEALVFFEPNPPPGASRCVCRIIEIARGLQRATTEERLAPIFARVEDDQVFVRFVADYEKVGKRVPGSNTTVIYQAYVEWARSNQGFPEPIHQRGFTSGLKRIGFETFKRAGARFWKRKREKA